MWPGVAYFSKGPSRRHLHLADALAVGSFVYSAPYDSNGRRHYYTDGFDAICETSSAPRKYEEVILGDKPCKFFVDLDDVSEEREAVLLACLAEYLRKEFDFKDDPLILECHREEKRSLHAIWQIWFENASHVKMAVQRAVAGHSTKGLDFSVYPSRGKTHPFRMAYSVKNEKTPPLVPKDGPFEFDAAVLARSMLTLYRPEGANLGAPITDLVPLGVLRRVHVEVERVSEFQDPGVVQRARDFAERKYGRSTDLTSGGFAIRPSLRCPCAGREHESNGTFVKLEFRGRSVEAWATCADAECNGTSWRLDDADWTAVVDPNLFRRDHKRRRI